MDMQENSFAVITACMNRSSMLRVSLQSWICNPSISEINIVDWSSDESLCWANSLDPRIRVNRIHDEEYFHLAKAFNIAIRDCTTEFIVKMDVDYILNPYYNLVKILQESITKKDFVVCDGWIGEGKGTGWDFLVPTNGFLCASKEALLEVGGYNESLSGWGYDDNDIQERLIKSGLTRKILQLTKVKFIYHNPHDISKRFENYQIKNPEESWRKNRQISQTGFDENKRERNSLRIPNTKVWKKIAITLDPKGERYGEFLENNKHLEIDTFQGIKGKDLSIEQMINQGLAKEELVTSPLLKFGLIGNAASHKAIWADLMQEGKGALVLEDDCCTHQRITDFIAKNIAILMKIDICFFGINTDSVLQSVSQTGLATLSQFSPKYPSQEWIRDALAKTRIENVELHRFFKGFGFCAYFVSPEGAKKLSEQLFPLSLETTNIPLITDKMPSSSIDRAGCRVYSEIKAYVCQPFLAYTSNTQSDTNE